MIILAAFMAVAAGCGYPLHLFLLGRVINQFVYHDVAEDIPAQSIADNRSISCSHLIDLIERGNVTLGLDSEYFCNLDGSMYGDILDYACDPDDTLTDRVSVFALYYVCVALGVLITLFLSTTLWNISAYKQSRRIRRTFYRSILHQDIAWFDMNLTAGLSTRLIK